MALANLHLKGLYDTTVEILSLLTPASLVQEVDPQIIETRDRYVETENPGQRSSLENELDSTSKEVARLRSELQLLRDKNRSLESALHETQRALSERDLKFQRLQEEHRDLEGNYNQLRRRAEERSSELRSLENFLTKTDRWSGAQVVQTLKDLNSEILQFSAAASESFSMDRRRDLAVEDKTHAIERVKARLGPSMSRCLAARDHSLDPTILQIALQSSASQCICDALSSFCVGFPAKFDSLLTKIYLHMHSQEPQATAARWRALTHSHIRSLTPTIDEHAKKDMVDKTLVEASNILAVSGYGQVQDIVEDLKSRYLDQIRSIAEAAYRIAVVVREGTMSTDFQVTFIEHSRTFSSDRMDNVYEGYGSSRGTVLCTTELGLRCFTQRGTDARSRADDGFVVDRLDVLKPKVVLESVLQALDPDLL
ncbi:hypothetical protein BD410DRAFT_821993 [Rickenella mellea]|uniref:Uncharacterized protein n=1 Tax=Rickenella mellea TaxID=50990 RepID=A0A4Y7PZ62_9AGAM|nr:hypothetical protein BD410DRAFT_821993 [Rickenella mellea]